MDVSIIIVNWNVCELLRHCLKSIYGETRNIEFEVIVVDNASRDGSIEMIKTNFSQVKLFENTKNKGFAAANNQAMLVAKGRYYLLLNPDTVILDNAIARTVKFTDKHPNAAITACKVLSPDGTLQRNCFTYPSAVNLFLSSTYLYKIFPKNRFFGREEMTWWQYDDVHSVEAVTGCFMLVRREVVDKLGGLDEEFFIYAEEADLCYRFTQAGWKIVFTPSPKIIHYGKKSSEQMPVKMALKLWNSKLLFIQKHNSSMKYILSCFLIGAFFLLRLPYWFVIMIMSREKRKEALLKLKTYAIATFRVWTGGGTKLMTEVK